MIIERFCTQTSLCNNTDRTAEKKRKEEKITIEYKTNENCCLAVKFMGILSNFSQFHFTAITAASDLQCLLAGGQILFALGPLITEVDERVDEAVEDDQQTERVEQLLVGAPAVWSDVGPSHADVVGQPTDDVDVDQHQRDLEHLEGCSADPDHVRLLNTW